MLNHGRICTSVAVEGFGAVGKAAVKFLTQKNANVIAVSDSKGAIYQPNGLDYEKLLKVKETTGAVKNYEGGRTIKNEDLFKLPVDILIPEEYGAAPKMRLSGQSKTR